MAELTSFWEIIQIGYLLQGTLSSYTLLLRNQFTKRHWANLTTYVALMFIWVSIIGRFAVAFLGFAYNLEDTAHYRAPLSRPDWVHLSILDRALEHGDGGIGKYSSGRLPIE